MKRLRFVTACAALAPLLLSAAALLAQASGNGGNRKLDQEFQAAVQQYNAGNLASAERQLEELLPLAPMSFELRELLGLVYARQSMDVKAQEQLLAAVKLNPDSAAARTNLATSYAHTGQAQPAVEQFQQALHLEPHDYKANHDLAEVYIRMGRLQDALPLLEEAHQVNGSSYDNSYDLAQAYFVTGHADKARDIVQGMTQQQDTGELHNLLGQIDEKDGRYLDAAHEFETAAHMDPSEENLFTWGSELLLHRTYDPAIDVFQKASERYPQSPRLLIGLGMALYSQGRYEESIKSLLTAADLDPNDARCYLFLSKAYLSSPNQAEDVIQRFRHYSELQPGNGLAQYYYAMSLWKGKRLQQSSVDFQTVEALLLKAISLDGKLAEAYLQLGVLYADQHQYDKSLPEYQRALALDPGLPDAHFRLGQYFVHAGQKDKAQKEFDTYQQEQAEHHAVIDKERAEVQQFVYSAKASPASKHE